MVIILSNWLFHDYWQQLSSEIKFTFCFEDISSSLEYIAAYQELIKIPKFDAFTLSMLIFKENPIRTSSNKSSDKE